MKVSKDALQLVITSHIGIDAVIKKFIPPSRPSSTERADQSNDGLDHKPTSSDVVGDDDSYIGDVQQIVVETEIVEDTSQYDTTNRHDKAADDTTIQYNNDEPNQQQRVSPVSVTKFDSFFMGLKDIENERRDQCTDSLQRLHKYRGQTYDGTRNNTDDDDNDVLVSINNSNETLQLQNKSTTSSSSSSPEVVQNVYGITKDVWEWGKNIPLLGGVFGLTEFTTNKLLEITIQVNDIDDILQPNLKKVDDHIVNPLIGMVSPVLSIGEEVIVKPVLHIVLPHIIGHDNDKKNKKSNINLIGHH